MTSKSYVVKADTASLPSDPTGAATAKKSSKGKGKAIDGVPPLGKFLASSDKKTRDRAVALLKKFLAGTTSKDAPPPSNDTTDDTAEQAPIDWSSPHSLPARLSEEALLRLWKGIWYCFWMSDKPLVQQALANELALATLIVRGDKSTDEGVSRRDRLEGGVAFWKAFWETAGREWSGIDHHRIDKFLLLVRRFVQVGFLLLAIEEWDEQAIELLNGVLTRSGGPLDITNQKIPHSLTYHLSDIYLDELEKSLSTPLATVTSSSSSPTKRLPLIKLLQAFIEALAIAPNKTIYKRIEENVFVPLLKATVSRPSTKDESQRAKRRKVDEGEESTTATTDEPEGFEAIVAACAVGGRSRKEIGNEVLDQIWEVAGRKETSEVSRRRMYLLVRSWRVEEL